MSSAKSHNAQPLHAAATVRLMQSLCPLQRSWLTAMWQGVQLLLSAVPLMKWKELAAYDTYLASKRYQFLQVPPLNTLSHTVDGVIDLKLHCGH